MANTIWRDLDPPHGHDDLLVSVSGLIILAKQDTRQIFYSLANWSKTSMADIFGANLCGWKFVVEGTRCPSVGVLRLQRRNVHIYYQEDKRKLAFMDSCNIRTGTKKKNWLITPYTTQPWWPSGLVCVKFK